MKVPFRAGVPASRFGMWRHGYLTALAGGPNVRETRGRCLHTLVTALEALTAAAIH